MYDIIARKQEGYALTKDEISYVIQGYTKGEIPDYQVSALLMAIYFKGMTIEETAALTMAIVRSGEIVDLSMIDGIKVDKHSTGGVGDTTTLILAPLVAACGVDVAKMSGRGLGHTGGTIDKLESIPGFQTQMTKEHFVQLVTSYHIAIIGQSDNLVPADKLLYSLRDVTATVHSIPLIASSIMSKKIASGTDAIVLDVKTGTGAFMKNYQDAKRLAEMMVAIGNKIGRKTSAIISNMDQPLGYTVGNALEMKEAIETLQGKGPKDLTELTLTLGSHMLVLANRSKNVQTARTLLESKLQNRDAITMFKTMVEQQGGNSNIVDQPALLKAATNTYSIKSSKDGYISSIIADEIGRAAMILGAGRQTKSDQIDLAVGVELHKKVGDPVNKGEPLCTIHANQTNITDTIQILTSSIIIGPEQQKIPLVLDMIPNTL